MLLHVLIDKPAPFDPLLLLLAALVIDACIGGRFLSGVIPHPVSIIGAAVAWLDAKLNREHRPARDRALRGGLVAAFVIVSSAAVGLGITWLSVTIPYAWLIELFLVTWLLAQRSLFNHVRAVGRALKTQGLQAGRNAVAHKACRP